MKLSILLVSHNHEQFIQECVEGIIIQNLPFEYEIIVADDFSTDNTLNIIRESLDKAKMNYRILPSTKNLGQKKNRKRSFEACRGEYIATLDGDDYWTSPNRLLNHISFLDNHRECVLSFNPFIKKVEKKSKFEIPKWDGNNDFEYITANEMALNNHIGNMSVCVFRHSVLKTMDEKLLDMGFADWFLGLYFGQYGLLAKQKEPTSVYRIHAKGAWQGKNPEDKRDRILELVDLYNTILDYKYNTEFQQLRLKTLSSCNTKKKLFSYHNIKSFIPPILILLVKLFIPIRILKFMKRKLK